MSLLPKYRPFRPDFMAPGPWVKVADKIELLESETNEQDEEDEGGGPSQYRYYKSLKVLGAMYRAIDEREFLKQLQDLTQPQQQNGQNLMRSIWAYVQHQTAGFQWEHHVPMALEIRELYPDQQTYPFRLA